MVLDHHRLRRTGDRRTETFRVADRIDAGRGPVRRAEVKAVVAELPYLGFHTFLLRYAAAYGLRHPTRPLPMLRW
ncbi:hypothetical protein [Nocardia sp. BMG51109]|uniref:hypothetical protein n=1 Tax=Nocardia sp. BMG51109 TaxID=1056816 RepID=UPI0006856A53|nr:hypothetical protein [Nocardia sp. BMG51109]